MASERQIVANRVNAKKSTGPKTDAGKQRSRRNAIRHGLSAETIVHAIEERSAYEAFEAEIKADYQPQTTVKHELVARLASLLWRLRRTTAIESSLLQIQARILRERKARNRAAAEAERNRLGVIYSLVPSINISPSHLSEPISDKNFDEEITPEQNASETKRPDLARSFLRLANLDSGAFERLGRYETRLWRQIMQTMLLLASMEKQGSTWPGLFRNDKIRG